MTYASLGKWQEFIHFMGKLHFMVHIYHIFCICSFVNAYLTLLSILALVSSTILYLIFEGKLCRILTKLLFSFIEVLYPWKHTSHSWYIRMFVINSFDLEGLWAFQCRIWIYGLSQLLVSIVVTLCFDSYCVEMTWGSSSVPSLPI